MSKKTVLEKHIKEMQKRVARLRENNEPKTLPRSVGLALLIESEIDKTESVINARAISSKLQDMAEDVVGLQGKQLFAMLEKMKDAYGPDFSEQFKSVAQQTLNTLMEQIGSAKDALDNQILRMEKIINGEPADDMSMDGVGGENNSPDGTAIGDDLGDDQDGHDPVEPTAEPDMQGEIDGDTSETDGGMDDALSDLGSPDNSNAAGRARKESFLSDRKVLEAFSAYVRKGNKPTKAAKIVAEKFSIDTSDVKEIVREWGFNKPAPAKGNNTGPKFADGDSVAHSTRGPGVVKGYGALGNDNQRRVQVKFNNEPSTSHVPENDLRKN
jgi:hypothetical protein